MDIKLTAEQYHVLRGYFKTAEKLKENEKELFRFATWINDTYGMNRQIVFEIFKNPGCIVEITPEKEDDFPKISREFWSYLEKGFERQREKLKEQGVIFKKENKPMRFFIYTGQDYSELCYELAEYKNNNRLPYDAIFVEPAYKAEFENMAQQTLIFNLNDNNYFMGILVTSTDKYKESFKKPDVKCTIQEAIKAYNDGKTIKQKKPNGRSCTHKKTVNCSDVSIRLGSILIDEWYICP